MRLFIQVLFLIASGCGYYRDEYGSATPPSPLAPGQEKALNYASVREVLTRNRCLQCHSEAGRNRGRVNLETYAKVKSFMRSSLEQIDMGFMPDDHGPSVSPADRQFLGDWYSAGSPR